MLTHQTASRPEQAAFVGRAAELEELRGFVSRLAHQGEARVLVGDAGVGKTRLLEAAREIAIDQGVQVINAAGTQFEADITYSGLNHVLLPVIGHLDALPPILAGALNVALGLGDGEPPRPLVVCNAALALLSAAGSSQPILVVVDDLPWLDRASASVLGFVARRLTGTRIGLLASFRTGEASLFEHSGLPMTQVAPLASPDAERLVSSRHPSLPPRVKQRLLFESGGNPLALLELADGLVSHGERHHVQVPEILPLTDRLERTFASRVAGLPVVTQRALLIIALDGRDDLRILSRTGISLDQLSPAERAAVLSVDITAMSVSFRHPLMRSAVVEHSTSDERIAAHRLLAEGLLDQPERRAWHLAEAAVEPDEDIASQLEDVAHRILKRGDSTAAIRSLTRAAQLSPTSEGQARRLAEAAYLGADVTGELTTASRLLADVMKLSASVNVSLHAAAAAAYTLLNADGDVDAAFQLLLGAIEAGNHGWEASDDELLEALSTLLLVCWWSGSERYWDTFIETIRRLQPKTPDLLWIQSQTFGDTARTGAAARPMLAALIDVQDHEFEPNRIIRVNTSSVYVDLLAGCRAGAWRLVEDGRNGGAVRSSLGALMHLCLDAFASGRWKEAQELADEGIATCRENGYDFIIWYFLFHESLLAAVRGDTAAAYSWADELTRVTSLRNAAGAERFAHHSRTLAAIAAGDWDAAFAHASRLSPAGSLRRYTPHALWVAFDLVEAAMRTGRRSEAEAHVQAMVDADLPGLSSRMALLTLGARALVAGDEASDLFAQALSVQGAEAWPFDYGRVALAFGEHLYRQGSPSDAAAPLREALDMFERVGADPWAERARSRLRATRAAGVPANAAGDITALTSQERAVAELAAEGLSNKAIAEKLFLSPRTVSGHLYRAFPKLGITSRAALRDALAPTVHN